VSDATSMSRYRFARAFACTGATVSACVRSAASSPVEIGDNLVDLGARAVGERLAAGREGRQQRAPWPSRGAMTFKSPPRAAAACSLASGGRDHAIG
jgi:hypothetical protein